MSLYGALYSGVSGLTAQSSAMGAISDNITNVSTIGYKNTNINFQTLVTKQTSTTFYSAGGVQSRPRQAVDVQGLLQASSSQTDLAISGGGFFVVNEASQPTGSDAYFYTRAGSFKQNSEGFLANSGGYFLQGWPTDASGNIVPANDSLTQTNLNVISNDYLDTINLSRVAGSAAATDEITIGANLPTNAETGDKFNTDVQFYDTLGAARSMNINYTKEGADNNWQTTVLPPQGTTVVTAFNASGNVYDSYGRLDFKATPADGSRITIDGITYEFDTDGFYGGAVQQVDQIDFATTPAGAWEPGDSVDISLTIGGSVQAPLTVVQSGGGTNAADLATDVMNAINLDATLSALVTASVVGDALLLTSNAPDVPINASGFAINAEAGVAVAGVQSTPVPYIAPSTVQVDVSTATTVSSATSVLVAAVVGHDTDFTTDNDRISTHPDDGTIVLFHDDGTANIAVNPAGLLDASGVAATDQTASFTVEKIHADYTAYGQFTLSAQPIEGSDDVIKINGIRYEFGTTTGGASDVMVAIGGDIGATMANLKTAIETNDPNYAAGTIKLREADGISPVVNDTIVIPAVSSAATTASVDATGMLVASFTALGATSTGTNTWEMTTAGGIVFDSKGLPLSLNMQKLQILGFTNGAADMDDSTANSPRMTLDFGVIGGTEGMTQFGDEFSPTSIDANGSRFGTFSGVSIGPDGLMTALFDNGDTRPIFRIPISTFVNPNGLEGRTGNVWNASEASGSYTLRTAGNGAAGVITQASLEASTVDIGSEFTQMIVVQRAYSASTKIISTADQMLEELMRTKR